MMLNLLNHCCHGESFPPWTVISINIQGFPTQDSSAHNEWIRNHWWVTSELRVNYPNTVSYAVNLVNSKNFVGFQLETDHQGIKINFIRCGSIYVKVGMKSCLFLHFLLYNCFETPENPESTCGRYLVSTWRNRVKFQGFSKEIARRFSARFSPSDEESGTLKSVPLSLKSSTSVVPNRGPPMSTGVPGALNL